MQLRVFDAVSTTAVELRFGQRVRTLRVFVVRVGASISQSYILYKNSVKKLALTVELKHMQNMKMPGHNSCAMLQAVELYQEIFGVVCVV